MDGKSLPEARNPFATVASGIFYSPASLPSNARRSRWLSSPFVFLTSALKSPWSAYLSPLADFCVILLPGKPKRVTSHSTSTVLIPKMDKMDRRIYYRSIVSSKNIQQIYIYRVEQCEWIRREKSDMKHTKRNLKCYKRALWKKMQE